MLTSFAKLTRCYYSLLPDVVVIRRPPGPDVPAIRGGKNENGPPRRVRFFFFFLIIVIIMLQNYVGRRTVRLTHPRRSSTQPPIEYGRAGPDGIRFPTRTCGSARIENAGNASANLPFAFRSKGVFFPADKCYRKK